LNFAIYQYLATVTTIAEKHHIIRIPSAYKKFHSIID